MYCSQCGQQLGEGVKFCGNCGTPAPEPGSAQPSFPPKPAQTPRPAGASPSALPPGAVPPAGINVGRLIERVKSILLAPKTEWPVIAAEASAPGSIYFGYVAPLVAIGVIASFLGSTLIGFSVPFVGTVRTGIVAGLAAAIVQFAMTFLGVFVLAMIVDLLAPTFGGTKHPLAALKVAAYSLTPGWVAAVLTIIPALGVIAGLIGLYGLYLLYLGLPVLMRNPPDKSIGYTVVVVVCAIVLAIVIGVVGAMVTGIFGVGAGLLGAGTSHTARETDAAADALARAFGGKTDADRARMKDAMSTLSKIGEDMERQQQTAKNAGRDGGAPPDLNQVLAAAGTLMAGGQKVEPVDFRKLKDLLPESVAGMPRTEASGQGGEAMGIKGSSAHARYAGDAGASITLEITDLGSLAGLAGLAGKFDPNLEKETETGYERTRHVDGNLVHERYDRRSRSGEITMLLANRFSVEASGRGVEPKVLAEALRAIDAKELVAAAK